VKNLIEEYTDVITCGRELSLTPDEGMIKKKQDRFLKRWKEKEEKAVSENR
jgi:hypothetical protein